MKKAQTGDFVFSITLILMMTIAGISLIGGKYLFFKNEMDYRQTESSALNYKISECLTKNPEIKTEEELFSECALAKKILEDNFLIIIEKNNSEFFQIGRGDKTRCLLADKNENFPICTTNTIKSKEAEFRITTGSYQKIRRVATI